MKPIQNPYERYTRLPAKGTPENANTEHNEYVGKFADRINSQPGNLVKISYPRMAKMIVHLSIQDLHFLWKRCEESSNFAACFRWNIKDHG